MVALWGSARRAKTGLPTEAGRHFKGLAGTWGPAALTLGLTLAGCGSSLDIEVRLMDPCDREVLGGLDYLRFEPRGDGVDSEGLSTVEEASSGEATPIAVPLVPDFRLVVTGHERSFETPPKAIGVSARVDLSSAGDPVRLPILMGGVDDFHRTTRTESPEDCSAPMGGRFGATATYVPALDKVVLIGGGDFEGGSFEPVGALEIYDPGSGEFSSMGASRASLARAFHSTTLIGETKLLVAGGQAALDGEPLAALRTAVLVDLGDLEKIRIADGILMREARVGHAAIPLESGLVVFLGGHALNPSSTDPRDQSYLGSLEIFDPEDLAFRLAKLETGGDATLAAARSGASATLLETGTDILVAGGYNDEGAVRSVEILHLKESGAVRVRTASAAISVGPIAHAATRIDDGRVLLAGGFDSLEDAFSELGPKDPSGRVEMWAFDAADDAASRDCTAQLQLSRAGHTLSSLGRRLLVAGGRIRDGSATDTAEIVSLAVGVKCFYDDAETLGMREARAGHTVTVLGSGELLMIGGRSDEGALGSEQASSTAEVFSPLRSP